MKICITGKNGYLGSSLKAYLNTRSEAEGFLCETVSVRDGLPDLTVYNAVVHAAAVVHIQSKDEKLYDRVNTRLTIALAKKAKAQGVAHFIFISTMSVYGQKDRIGRPSVIDWDTPEKPTTLYGQSKLRAEQALQGMQSDDFVVSIIRPPMVYGDYCSGNYARLAALAKITPVFPYVENERSVLHIDHFCELVRLILTHRTAGIYCPQDREYACTARMVADIGRSMGRKIALWRWLGVLVCLCPVGPLAKMFGSLTYSKVLSNYFDYAYCGNEE